MRDLTDRVLDTAAQLGASYADVRVIRRRDESIAVKSGRVEGVAMGETDGFGVRVVVDGAWGFAASDTLDLAEADRVGALAVRIAKASSTALRRPVELDGRAPATGTFETPVADDPFKIPLERKISDLVAADRAAGAVKGVTFTESMYAGSREWKTFAATDGSFTEQVKLPSVAAKVFHSREPAYIDSVKVTPFTAPAARSAATRSEILRSSGILNGSSATGVSKVPVAGARPSSSTGRRNAVDDALAMRTARAPTRSASARSSVSEAAKPHAPSTTTRTPKPSVSPIATPSTRPLLTAIDSSRRRI